MRPKRHARLTRRKIQMKFLACRVEKSKEFVKWNKTFPLCGLTSNKQKELSNIYITFIQKVKRRHLNTLF